MKKIVLIDGNGLIFRAFYATFNRMSRALDGTPTNAVYLFSSIMIRLLEKHDFDNIIVCLDSKGPKFRHKEYSQYKGNRKEIPIELAQQFEPIKEFLNYCNVTTIEIPGYEADDIIGTLAFNSKYHDANVEIYTGDRDLLQLIEPNVHVNMMITGLSETKLFNIETLKETYNLSPRQIIDLKALMGDASDNIPGVAGVGEKTAFSLLAEYSNLDNLYANIDNIKGKLQEKLINGKDMAYLSYKLATIYQDVPVDLSILDNIYETYNETGLNTFFKKYNMKSLLKYSKESKEEKFEVSLNIVDKISKSLLKENSLIYVDIDNEEYHYGNIKGIAISNGVESEYISIDYAKFDFDFLDYLKSSISKDAFDLKQCYISLYKEGIELNGVFFDTVLASYLLRQDIKNKEDIFAYYNIHIDPKEKNITFDNNALYCLKIAKASVLIKEKLLNEIKEIENEKLLFDIEIPLALILAKMEINGVLIDINLLNKLSDEYSSKIKEIEDQIFNITGFEFNINSPKQLAEVLFDKLGLPCNKKRSTSADDLKAIINLNPIIPLILEQRKYSKLLNTYIDSFNEYRFADNRIHAMFNQYQTMTGRLSSSCPNLQNLSIRDEDRSIIRQLIIAKPGYKILSLDYSQIELRILAILSNDKNMLDAFASGVDVHTMVASKLFNVSNDKVTSNLRRKAKAINFGIVYGMSSWGLAEQLSISLDEANGIIKKFFESYPDVKNYLDNSIKFCQENGYIKTMFNRRRNVPEINSSNYNLREFAKRVAMNSPIQGSAADIMKLSMIKVNNYLKTCKFDIKLCCQIHDELLFEVKEENVLEALNNIKEIMENVIDHEIIKLKVSYAYGNNWLEAK